MRVILAVILAIFSGIWGCNRHEFSYRSPKRHLSYATGSNKSHQELSNLCDSNTYNKGSGQSSWTFMVYMAANNNLRRFAIDNIYQMSKIGSNENVNIIVLLDEFEKKKLARYRVAYDGLFKESEVSYTQAAITGTRESLYDFFDWTVQNYSADHYCLVLWNHGSGIKDPSNWGRFITSYREELFKKGPVDHLAIDRSFKDMTPIEHERYISDRGICFNDTFGTYLTNQDLVDVLSSIQKNILYGRKIDIICMDACLMAMAEMASQLNPYCDYFVASQEVEPGAGYNYALVLSPFVDKYITPYDFARHIVHSYSLHYDSHYADYTQSAMNLEFTDSLDEYIAELSSVFTHMLNDDYLKKATVEFLHGIRFGSYGLEFEDSDYIDLGLLLKGFIKASYSPLIGNYRELIINASEDALTALKRIVILQKSGINLSKTSGLSIYFPRYTLHSSYEKTEFSKKTGWGHMLSLYLKELH